MKSVSPPPTHNAQKIQFVKICANSWLKIPHPLIRGINTNPWGWISCGVEGVKKAAWERGGFQAAAYLD